jgi:hypothetical protein
MFERLKCLSMCCIVARRCRVRRHEVINTSFRNCVGVREHCVWCGCDVYPYAVAAAVRNSNNSMPWQHCAAPPSRG